MLLLLLAGVFGAIIIGAFIDKTHKYKCAMKSVTAMIAFCTVMVIATLTWFNDSDVMFIGWLEVLGLFGTGYIPLCLSYGAELTFPLAPALVNGTLTMVGSGCSFALSLLGAFMNNEGQDDHLLDDEELMQVRRLRSKNVIAILIVASLIAFVLSHFIQEDLRRH